MFDPGGCYTFVTILRSHILAYKCVYPVDTEFDLDLPGTRPSTGMQRHESQGQALGVCLF